MIEFSNGLRFRQRTIDWSDDQKRDWMVQRLRFSIRRAARETPYYEALLKTRGIDPRADFGFEILARLPVLERADVHGAGAALRSGTVLSDQVREDATGGSTGEPTRIWTGPEERGWRESGIEFFMRRVGLPPGTRTALLWGHHLDPHSRATVGERLHDWVDNSRWFDCLRLSPDALRRYHAELERWQPQLILAYASSLGDFAEELERIGVQPSYPTRALVTGAEKLLADKRRVVERVFRRPVYERYGSRDVGLIGFQMTAGHDYVVDWANVLVEPETEEEYSPILITKLHADAMPLIRYRIGDIGHFPAGSRPAAPAFALRAVVGREADRIWLPSQRWVHGLGLPHLLKDHPVRDFQLVQHRDLSVLVRVVPSAEFGDHDRSRILDVLRANLSGVALDLVLVDEIPKSASNKRRPVISHVEPLVTQKMT
jgi:phenylacetate-coenzyme A ligase PaaK-like adenylate-forming protein